MKLELRGLTKRFGSFVANDHIDLTVEPGQIHGLLGENGAGKTTLMNMLYGLLEPDEGEIRIDDEPVEIGSPADAVRAGVGMVHQHFMLVPVFTVAENVTLGRERTRGPGFLDRGAARRLVVDLSQRYGLEVDPDRPVGDLPVGVQQRVEILKALASGARVLVLDEPTAVLTPQETDELFTVMRSLRAAGTAIVFITHKLKEVQAIADRITVIRRGEVVTTVGPETAENELAELMVGRSVRLTADRAVAEPEIEPGDADRTEADRTVADRADAEQEHPVLAVDRLTVLDDAGSRAVDEASFEVRAGEVFGVAGVQGNGQSELARALLGLLVPAAGSLRLNGRELAGRPPSDWLAAGVGYIPEDRGHDGFVGSMSVAENLVLDLFRRAPFGRGLVLSPGAIRRNAESRVEEFDIRTRAIDTPVSTLSGGNQQKVVLARELSRPLSLLVAAHPTRGLDVGSIEFVHNRLVEERARGAAIVLVSTELDEILALSDRIAVMYRGRIVGVVGPRAPRDQLGLMMAGASVAEAEQEAEDHPTALGTMD